MPCFQSVGQLQYCQLVEGNFETGFTAKQGPLTVVTAGPLPDINEQYTFTLYPDTLSLRQRGQLVWRRSIPGWDIFVLSTLEHEFWAVILCTESDSSCLRQIGLLHFE